MSPSAMRIQDLLRGALDFAHQVLEGTMGDVDDELANRRPQGSANPIGAAYAHAVLSEDGIVNGVFKGQAPLFATSWAGRIGTDRPMPMPNAVEGDLGEWYHSVKVKLPSLRQYAQAVYANSQAFIESADDETLAREVQVGPMRMPMASAFEAFLAGHCSSLAGEISAIKGTFGRKGYSF